MSSLWAHAATWPLCSGDRFELAPLDAMARRAGIGKHALPGHEKHAFPDPRRWSAPRLDHNRRHGQSTYT